MTLDRNYMRSTVARRVFTLFLLAALLPVIVASVWSLISPWAALIIGGHADEFLATQGDIWDTQWDMFLALSGAISAQLLLARVQDRQLEQL